jgi:hypothetical protein
MDLNLRQCLACNGSIVDKPNASRELERVGTIIADKPVCTVLHLRRRLTLNLDE